MTDTKEPLKSRGQEISDKIDEAMRHLHQVPSPDKESPSPSRRQGMTPDINPIKSSKNLERLKEILREKYLLKEHRANLIKSVKSLTRIFPMKKTD